MEPGNLIRILYMKTYVQGVQLEVAHLYIYDITSLSYSYNKKCHTDSCRENENTYSILNNFFPENRTVCEIMWKNMVEPDRPKMTIWRMRVACWIIKPYIHTLRICNIYCFSTATVVTRTPLSIMLQVRCLSCSFCMLVMCEVNLSGV